MPDVETAISAVIAHLEREGFVVERNGDTLSVGSTEGLFAFAPVVHLPSDLLRDYLRQSPCLPTTLPPEDEALSLLEINIAEELGTDHGEGRNYVRSVGLRRGRDGQVALITDKDVPRLPVRAPDPHLRWEARRPSAG